MSPFFFSLLMQKALKQANDAKEEGNKLFRTGQYEDALLKYELALQIASEVTSSVDVCSMCHGNRAACFLKLVSHSFGVNDDDVNDIGTNNSSFILPLLSHLCEVSIKTVRSVIIVQGSATSTIRANYFLLLKNFIYWKFTLIFQITWTSNKGYVYVGYYFVYVATDSFFIFRLWGHFDVFMWLTITLNHHHILMRYLLLKLVI